ICVEVKDNQGHQPLRLLVDFLRVWYDDEELKQRLGQMPGAASSCAYFQSVIQRNSLEGNLRKQLLLQDFQLSLFEKLEPKLRGDVMQDLANMPEGVLLAMESAAAG